MEADLSKLGGLDLNKWSVRQLGESARDLATETERERERRGRGREGERYEGYVKQGQKKRRRDQRCSKNATSETQSAAQSERNPAAHQKVHHSGEEAAT